MLVCHVVEILDNLLYLISLEDDSFLEASLLNLVIVLQSPQVLTLVKDEAVIYAVLEDIVNPERLDLILRLIEIRLLQYQLLHMHCCLRAFDEVEISQRVM